MKHSGDSFSTPGQKGKSRVKRSYAEKVKVSGPSHKIAWSALKVDRFGNDEEEGIRAGFCEGFSYDEILALLDINFSVDMSIAALKRYMKQSGP